MPQRGEHSSDGRDGRDVATKVWELPAFSVDICKV